MKTETIIFLAVVLANGAIALWKKRKERAAAAAAAAEARRAGQASKPVAPGPARPRPVAAVPARPQPVATVPARPQPVAAPVVPAAARPSIVAAPVVRMTKVPAPQERRAPVGLGRTAAVRRDDLANRLRTGFLFAEIYGRPRWQAPLH